MNLTLTSKLITEEGNFRLVVEGNEELHDNQIAEQLDLEPHIYQEVIKDQDGTYIGHDGNIYFEKEEDAGYAIDSLKYYIKENS